MEKAKHIIQTPTFFLVVLFSCFSFIAYARMNFLCNDLYLHLFTGRWIYENGMIPHNGVGSWLGEMLPWYAHEWLSGLAIYGIWQFIQGIPARMVFVMAAFESAFVGFLIYWNRKKIKHHYIWAIFLFLALEMNFLGQFYWRPQIFFFTLFLAELVVLRAFYINPKTRWILALPIIAVLWANLHGGSSSMAYLMPVGMIIAGMIPLDKISNRFKRTRIRNKKRLLLFSFITALALMLNPSGYHMVLYPYTNMADQNMLYWIMEWHPFNISDRTHIQLGLVMFYTWFMLLATKRRISTLDFFFCFGFTVMGTIHIRLLVTLAIYSAFAMVRYLPRQEYIVKSWKDNAKKAGLLVLLLPLAWLSCYASGHFLQTEDMNRIYQTDIQAVKSFHPQRLWNRSKDCKTEFAWNGVRAAFDGRADVYTGDLFLYGNSQDMNQFNPKVFLEKFHPDYASIDRNDAMLPYAEEHKEIFDKVYEGEHIVLFRIK